jgi:ubiquinone/menaquinone biosynthesis C-methylase UbiE
MPEQHTYDPQSFKGMEHTAWEQAASVYDDFLGVVTSHAAGALLDSTRVNAGTRLLEVCCGPGYGVRAAAARGAIAVGVDFAQAMVDVARQQCPHARFQQGDAETLPFDNGSFDAVICAFGLRHLPEPEQAIAEAYRVLVSGGQYAFTDWCAPDKVQFFELVLGAIQTHGTMQVPLPAAPPPFRFSDPVACVETLRAAGFVEPVITEIPLFYYPPTAEHVLAFTYKVAPRMQMVLALQTADARERIHQAIVEGATSFAKGGGLEIAMPALLASAHKS